MIEVSGTLRCRCGVTRSVVLSLTAYNNEVVRRDGNVRFGIKNVTVHNHGDWFIDDHGTPTCPKCRTP